MLANLNSCGREISRCDNRSWFAPVRRRSVEGGADDAVARRVEVRVATEAGNQAVVVGVPGSALEVGTAIVSPRPLDGRDGTRVRVVDVEPAGTPP